MRNYTHAKDNTVAAICTQTVTNTVGHVHFYIMGVLFFVGFFFFSIFVCLRYTDGSYCESREEQEEVAVLGLRSVCPLSR